MKPRIFIGSSLEGKQIADALQANLNYAARCTVWHQAFPLSKSTIDTLLVQCAENDFAIFVYSDDDVAKIRANQYAVARDNVVFESGLFMGMHGKERGFIVVPQGMPNFHIPTDLLGLTLGDYDAAWAKKDPLSALGAATTKITQAISTSAWATYRLDISARPLYKATGATFPMKLFFTVMNNHRDPVTIESLSFELSPPLQADPRIVPIAGTNTYRLPLYIGKTDVGSDIHVERCVIEPRNSVTGWVAIDPTSNPTAQEATITTALKSKSSGIWKYRCYWHAPLFTMAEYEDRF